MPFWDSTTIFAEQGSELKKRNGGVIVSRICGESSSRCLLVPSLGGVLSGLVIHNLFRSHRFPHRGEFLSSGQVPHDESLSSEGGSQVVSQRKRSYEFPVSFRNRGRSWLQEGFFSRSSDRTGGVHDRRPVLPFPVPVPGRGDGRRILRCVQVRVH